jgi:hypothetical protein
MRYFVKKSFVLIASIAIFSACTSRYASNGENIYMNSYNSSSLVISPPLTEGNLSHFYDLPALDKRVNVRIEPPVD